MIFFKKAKKTQPVMKLTSISSSWSFYHIGLSKQAFKKTHFANSYKTLILIPLFGLFLAHPS